MDIHIAVQQEAQLGDGQAVSLADCLDLMSAVFGVQDNLAGRNGQRDDDSLIGYCTLESLARFDGLARGGEFGCFWRAVAQPRLRRTGAPQIVIHRLHP